MKFLVEAHLPLTLCRILRDAGHDVLHTSELPAQNRTSDEELTEIASRESRVVITKDSDFYHSHVLRGVPPQLILVRTGNIGVRDLCSLFSRHLPAILQALQDSTLVELDRQNVRASS